MQGKRKRETVSEFISPPSKKSRDQDTLREKALCTERDREREKERERERERSER